MAGPAVRAGRMGPARLRYGKGRRGSQEGGHGRDGQKYIIFYNTLTRVSAGPACAAPVRSETFRAVEPRRCAAI